MRQSIPIMMLVFLSGCGPSPYAGQPRSQEEFVQFLHKAKSNWANAVNSLQQEGMPAQRDAGLCRMKPEPHAWVGVVDRVGSFLGDKFVSLKLRVAEDIVVRTGGDLSDDKYKIPRNSKMFGVVSQLGPGMKVRFSGEFEPNEKGCAREVSLTNSGAFDEPEFIASFSSVERAE